jgi:hypothetical protein
MNRFVKRQEIFDEEKRIKIKEMRESGIVVENRKGNSIPFGVRALESGIEVDGIWISRSNSPIPESLKLARACRSSDSAVLSKSEDDTDSIQTTQSSRAHMSYPGAMPMHSPVFRPGTPIVENLGGGDYIAAAPKSPPRSRPAYKPKRSTRREFCQTAYTATQGP